MRPMPREWKYSSVSAGPVWKMSSAPDVVMHEWYRAKYTHCRAMTKKAANCTAVMIAALILRFKNCRAAMFRQKRMAKRYRPT